MPALTFVWALGVGAAFVSLLFFDPHVPKHRQVWLVAAAASIVNLVPILLYPEPEGLLAVNINNYAVTARLVLDLNDVYLGNIVLFHPYLPFQMYVFAAMRVVSDATPIPFFVMARMPNAAALVGTAVLVLFTMRQYYPGRAAFRTAMVFALCPFPMLVAVYHGQFDSISVFFAVASFYLVLGRSHRSRDISAIALGLGTLQKFWPGMLGIVLLAQIHSASNRLRYVAISGAVVLLSITAYIIAFDSSIAIIIDHTLAYEPPFPDGGFLLVLRRLGPDRAQEWWLEKGQLPTLAAVVAVSALTAVRRADPFEAAVAVLCALFVLVPDAALYHYTWILPFGLIAGHRWLVAALSLMVSTHYLIQLYIGGGMFYPGFDGPGLAWLSRRPNDIAMASWCLLVGWLAWSLWRIFRGDPVPSPHTTGTPANSV